MLLLVTACKKDAPDALPEATQDGRGTAGFLLDGALWLPEWKSNTSTNSPVDASWRRTPAGRSLRFGFSRLNDQEYRNVDFFVPDIKQSGTFQLNQSASPVLGFRNPSYGSYVIDRPTPVRIFLTGPMATGTLIITRFDTVARVVSGTFEMTVREDGGPDSLHITQGRSDLTF